MTMRILITGAAGFVGSHLPQALASACGRDVKIIATSKAAGQNPAYGAIEALDVLDGAAVARAIERHAPTHVIHLAGIAAPCAANANLRLDSTALTANAAAANLNGRPKFAIVRKRLFTLTVGMASLKHQSNKFASNACKTIRIERKAMQLPDVGILSRALF